MIFYLGTHKPGWLARLSVPLFVSRRRLADRVTVPRALSPWALDSGAFTEINLHGKWTLSHRQYADEARRYQAEIGQMQWAAIQDWMCEPDVLVKTGYTIERHQALTTESLLQLRDLAPGVPWVPVLQGWAIDDYLSHVGQYRRAGVDLTHEPLVGVGSVCRRQSTDEIAELFSVLHSLGVPLHGFGVKIEGLARASTFLASADSMAWSKWARNDAPLPGCEHRSCANCERYALQWRAKVLAACRRRNQRRLIFL